jgi:hypothetical protein
MSRVNPLHRAADRHRQRFERLTLRAFGRAEYAMRGIRLFTALQSQDRGAVERAAIAALPALKEALQPLEGLLLDVLSAGAAAGSRLMGPMRFAAAGPHFTFDSRNEQALAWAQAHAGELVVDISKSSEKALREAITRSFQDKLPVGEAERLIRKSVGLTKPGAEAVFNLRKRILEHPGRIVYAGAQRIRVPEGGMPAQRLQSTLQRYSEKLIRSRVSTIASHETITASLEGQRQLWKQAADAGVLTGNEIREWIVFEPCPQCAAYANERTRLGQPYHGGVMGPPLHIKCRCTEGIVNARPRRAPRALPSEIGEGTVVDTPGPVLPDVPPVQAVPKSELRIRRTSIKASTRQGRLRAKDFQREVDQEVARFRAEYSRLGKYQVRHLNLYADVSNLAAEGHENADGLYRLHKRQITVALGHRPPAPDSFRISGRTPDGRIDPYLTYWRVTDTNHLAIFRHEFGHHVHLKEFRAPARREWNNVWSQMSTTPQYQSGSIRRTVSEYAATNEKELFAESFAVYTHPKYVKGTLPRVIESFMEEHVGLRKIAEAVPAPPQVIPVAPRIVPKLVPEAPKPQAPTPIPGAKVKMTADAVREIRRRREAGESLGAIAKDYGVAPQYIRQIALRLIWKDVA